MRSRQIRIHPIFNVRESCLAARMETIMFSLKLDVLFPSVAAAKELARKFNGKRNSRKGPAHDPREIARIRTELNLARESERAKALRHRYHVF